MFCKECGTQFEGKFCPSCGDSVDGQAASVSPAPVSTPAQTPASTPAQTPAPTKKKKGCLIAIVVIVVLFFALIMSAPDEGSNTVGDASNSGSDIDICELYELIGRESNVTFTLTAKAKNFLSENEELFSTENLDLALNHTNYSIEYKHLSKNVSNYGDELMNIYAEVVQAQEFNVGNGTLFTSINVITDEGNQYYVFYKGALAEVFEGDMVDIYGLPLDMSGFENTDGGRTLTPILAGSYVVKSY